MKQETALIRQHMRTPRAAAIAGIVFSLLLITSQFLIWTSIPSNPLAPAAEVVRHSKTISLALNLLSFAGIAFLWFIAVVRDRLGEFEDRFFATVILGSGLLYIAMTFVAATVAGGIIRVLSTGSENLAESGAYALGRVEINHAMLIYAAKMAGVFMMSTSTISLKTQIVPRWMALLGYALALMLLLSVGTIEWIPLIFPLWVLLISLYILMENLRGQPENASAVE
ncbi:MAG: hypothetical protein WCC92_19745 [Candidatus Korobacteraceae bacterium]